MPNIRKISLNEVELGMYVVEIESANNKFKVKMGGKIRKQAHLDKMKVQNVQFVYIDFDRGDVSTTLSKSAKKENQKKNAPVSATEEMASATALYDQAKSVQKSLLKSVTNKKIVDNEMVQNASGQIMDSILRNQDALLLITTLKDKNSYDFEHAINCCIFMTTFAVYLNLELSIVNEIATGAFIHDLGKHNVSSEILNKPRKLNEQEFSQIRKHVIYGKDILQKLPNVGSISLDLVANHHERLDGTGYPEGLTGEAISRYARMMAIVDTYDAMTSNRVYQKSCPQMKAFNTMLEQPEKYDTELIQQFIKCLGIYPVGSLIKLKSGRIGIVYRSNRKQPLKPIVVSFYSYKQRHHIEPKMINLAKSSNEEIEMSIQAEDIDVPMNRLLLDSLFS